MVNLDMKHDYHINTDCFQMFLVIIIFHQQFCIYDYVQ